MPLQNNYADLAVMNHVRKGPGVLDDLQRCQAFLSNVDATQGHPGES